MRALRRVLCWPTGALLLGLLAACASRSRSQPEPRASAAQATVRSNILRSDYAGSDECRYCHAGIHRAWERSPMRHMTRRESSAHIEAPFHGESFQVKADSALMEMRGGRRFVRLSTIEDGMRLFRITKVIGGRYREDFAGIDVTGAADFVRDRGRGAELIMPVSFVRSSRSWRYKGYSVMVPERPGLRPGSIWASSCLPCHNTVPYATLLYDDLFGRGAPSYQGTVSDKLLPSALLWSAEATDEDGLRRAVTAETEYQGGSPMDPDATSLNQVLLAAMDTMQRKFDDRHLVEVGIGCEACHGGAREHVEDHRLRPSFEVQSPLLRVGPSAGPPPTRAQAINRTCARCHTVLFSRYPFTWEGKSRHDAVPGGSTTNSGEARDFLLGGCSSQLACTACHDPHAEDRPDRLQQLAGLQGNAICVDCHTGLQDRAALAAHTHHQPDGAGSACVACHMPKKNMGLGYGLTRYHRIGSPTDQERVLGDRPLECALCHTDRSVEGLVTDMERFWRKRYDRSALKALYGPSLDENVLRSTLERGKAHEQAAAIAVLGEQRRSQAIADLVPHLAHQYPLVRYYAKEAIETITGQPLPVDVNEPARTVRDRARRWFADTWK